MAMNPIPKVSVVIPIYNRRELLQRSLGSVLAQSEQHIEVLIVDDHSDEPMDSPIAGYRDERVRLIRLPRRAGVSGARNAGIEESRAPLIAFLDSDDSWHSNKLTLFD